MVALARLKPGEAIRTPSTAVASGRGPIPITGGAWHTAHWPRGGQVWAACASAAMFTGDDARWCDRWSGWSVVEGEG